MHNMHTFKYTWVYKRTTGMTPRTLDTRQILFSVLYCLRRVKERDTDVEASREDPPSSVWRRTGDQESSEGQNKRSKTAVTNPAKTEVSL